MNRVIVGMGALCLIGVVSQAWASPYSDAVNALGPDAYYRGNEGSGVPQDTTGHGHNLSNFNNNTYGAGPGTADGLPGMGAGNGAYQFTGAQVARSGETTTKYIPAVGQAARTVVSWINLDTTAAQLGGDHNIWSWGASFAGGGNPSGNTGTNWSLHINEGFNPTTGTGTGHQNAILNVLGRSLTGDTTPITVNAWHMIAISFAGDGTGKLGDATMYVDGVLQTVILGDTTYKPITGGANVDGNVLGFRLGQDLGSFGFNGRSDEVSVFTKTLSATDVLGLYAAATGAPVPEPATMGLLGVAISSIGMARRRGA